MVNSPGVYKLTSEEYHADPAPEPSLSRSTIKDLLFRSAAHAKFNHPRLNPDFKEEEAEKFDKGTAAHSLLLEGSDNIEIIDADDWRSKAAKDLREVARKAGKTPLLTHQYEETKVMVAEAEKQILLCTELKISGLRADGDAELSFVWQVEEYWHRTRVDWISKDRKLILDYKTTGLSANPNDVSKNLTSIGLDIQNALYISGVKAIEGIEPKFIFIFQETESPYLCSFIALSPQFLEMGRSKCEFGLWLWKKCLSTNIWEGYPNRVAWVEPPAWALASWEQIGSQIGMGEK